MILFHGLGDNEASFASFATNLSLPGVLSISLRGVSPLPPSLFSDGDEELGEGTKHFHWGDDLRIDSRTGGLDEDPGFGGAKDGVGRVLSVLRAAGWTEEDVLLFGFGQGGSLALGLARGEKFKGAVSVGGGLPGSMVVRGGSGEKGKTPVMVCHGRGSEAVGEEAVERLREEFEDVRDVEWKRGDDGMPRSREEVVPMMEFFGERLRG